MNLIEKLRTALEAAKSELATRSEALDSAHLRVMDAGEDDNVEELRTRFDAVVSEFEEAKAEVERCKKNLHDAEERQRILDENKPAQGAPATARGGRTELVYRPDTHERSFFRDAFA